MATPILQSTPGTFNFTPNIIPPSSGDLEEARIKRLMDLAKLQQLQQDPLIQRQQLDLQRSQLGETGRHNVATEAESNAQLVEAVRQHHVDALLRQSGLDLEQRGQDVTQRGQDVQTRGQDIGAKTTSDVIAAENARAQLAAQTQTTDTLIGHMLGSFPQTDDKLQLAKVLALRGHPEMLKVLGEKTTSGTGDPLADATLEYMKNKKAGTTTTTPASTGGGSVTDILKSLFVLPGLR